MSGVWGADPWEGDGFPWEGVKREWSPVQGAVGSWAEPGERLQSPKTQAPVHALVTKVMNLWS